MEAFKSIQFNAQAQNPKIQPMKLFPSTRKLYPELASILDLEAKQERFRKLQSENNPLKNP